MLRNDISAWNSVIRSARPNDDKHWTFQFLSTFVDSRIRKTWVPVDKKRDYRTFQRLWGRAQSSWVISLSIFVEQLWIYNAKRLWHPMGFPQKTSKPLTVFSLETVKIKKTGQFNSKHQNYGQITLNTKPHSAPRLLFLSLSPALP